MLEFAKCLVKFDVTICSRILHGTPVRDMGRYFAGSDLSPFQKWGICEEASWSQETSFVDLLCFLCLVFAMPFLRICLYVPCGHLLGKR